MSEITGSTGSCSSNHESHLGCAQVIAQIWTLLDGECQPDEKAILQRHLDACPGCLQHYGLEERIKELIATKCSGEKAPERLRERLRLEIRRTTIVQTEIETQ
ncbi:mycothiol system anti-sigma-R factor [Mycobacterium asiaticum]|uniref:Mycothiol system anti-sigma-R factor n=1 Tax=Mycobacterium asiaticum TaxID=1790 RepID=A0A1A3CA03_MYCAS|nr:mycothiol system anti-sigma-R factor [Mycobacterium asiaticum]OBI83478.1 mycothiol system anti-sigma-R factor [Mycobacterium asiaticum]OBI86978.1 mycothiol system anti-sigma-R factor [Mycobacterium asiaticum]OBJ66041.1 mycothiol system anti-sigma-R factor [Mycobacterium asiaticum]OBJ90115.1 mycothiol system anti-sigma-R factor [Mycobacterium asiaticum]OBK14042.1 mycothiol system anti-sigma-R factor [Mycobacterium asiaticum]